MKEETLARQGTIGTANSNWQRRICQLELKVTELNLRNDQLRTALEEARGLEDSQAVWFREAPAALVVLNTAGSIVKINEVARQMLGIPSEESEPGKFGSFLAREDIRAFLSHLRDCVQQLKPMTLRVALRIPNRAPLPVRLTTVYRKASSRQHGFFEVLISDESDYVALKTELQHYSKAQHDFIESMEGILWEAEWEMGRRTYVSCQAERLLGYPVADWLNNVTFWANHIVEEDRDRVLNLATRAVASRQNYTCEYRMLAADRRVVWLRECVNVVNEKDTLKLRGLSMDITERKRIEEQLAFVQASLEKHMAERTDQLMDTIAELEAFSYTLSHDMRAPLRAMHGYSELLLDSGRDRLEPGEQEYLQRIKASARRLDGMICDVLKYSKVARTAPTLEPVDLDKLLQSVIVEYPNLQSSGAEIEIHSPLLPVIGHEAFLSQCISNLLSNAVKFVSPGTAPKVCVRTEQAGSHARIWVEDNGIGISAQDQRQILRMFQTDHPQQRFGGTGIGLEIVNRAVRRMGGQVGVESSPGKGSKFWVQLQRA